MLVKSVSFLPESIKSMKPMQNYPYIIELFACTRKMLAFFVFIPCKAFNLFRNMFNTKTTKIKKFTFFTK